MIYDSNRWIHIWLKVIPLFKEFGLGRKTVDTQEKDNEIAFSLN